MPKLGLSENASPTNGEVAMITVKIDDKDLKKALKDLQARSRNTSSAMAGIASVMLASVEDNFRAEGRPRWAALKASTIQSRTKQILDNAYYKRGSRKGTLKPRMAGLVHSTEYGGRGLKILQKSGHLAGSITPFHSRTIAGVGTNVPYAAAMNNGSKPHEIRAKKTKALKVGALGYFKRVKHPGTVARPFMTLSEKAKLDIIQAMLLHITGKK
jgi:phage gpG-like protein